jgi:hypothetical protein
MLAVEARARTARCPFCGQSNVVPESATPITGRCSRCQRPLDDHGFVDGQLAACPQAIA